MSDKPDKNATNAQVDGEFFGSVADTLRDARKKGPTIKLQDVKDWFAKNYVRRTNLRGYNSYIANYAHQEYRTCSSSMIQKTKITRSVYLWWISSRSL